LEALTAEEISGALVWKHIAVDGDFTAWPNWPGLEGVLPGQSPHGRYHEIFISPALAKALPILDRKAPEKSIIAKRNYDASKKPVGFTVMAKVHGYNPENGDWFWASYGMDGSVKAEGKVAMCIRCHEGMKGNDYVIVHPLNEE
jgi:hypothetical protein